MIKPTSLTAQPITGYYETLIREGGRLKGRYCDCSAPLLPPDPRDGYRETACLKGQSCYHVATRILFVLVARGWSVQAIATLTDDSSNVGLAWLRAQEDEEFYYRHEQASQAVLDIKTAGRTPKRRKSAREPFTGFEYRYTIWHRLLSAIEENPGIGVRELERLLCNNEGGKMLRKGHLTLYVEEGLRQGYIGFTLGARNKHEHFVITRPEPPVMRYDRQIRPGEDTMNYVTECRERQAELIEWQDAYTRYNDAISVDEAFALLDLVGDAIEADKAPVSHSETLNTASGTRAHLDDFKSLESDTANATEEEILDIIRVMSLC